MNYDLNFLLLQLTVEERGKLSEITNLPDNVRFQNLKDFFHKDAIFSRIKSHVDPTWLAYYIFINKPDIPDDVQ